MRILLTLLLVCCWLGQAFATEPVGTVKTATGEAFIERQKIKIKATVGVPVFADDRLLTGKQSTMGLILQDDTTLSLGPESEVEIREFVFAPKESKFSLVLKILKGTFLYMSGVIGKLAPESIKLETPESTISVRGTRLLIEVSR